MKNKCPRFVIILLGLLIFVGSLIPLSCVTNPLSGKNTMAFVSNTLLFPSSFQQYQEFLSENKVITGTADARMVARVGDNIRKAAEKWLVVENNTNYLKDYQWEYNLVQSDEINAWCMPGGKIVVYTGILKVTQNEDALAAVLGHEVSHALLNHGQQRMSANVLQQLGAVGVAILLDGTSAETQQLAMTAYGVGSALFGTLPFSRSHESEADYYGLILMAVAGYNAEEATAFWRRMNALGSGGPEFLSTHPSSATRITALRNWIPEAKAKAAEINGKVR